MEQRSPKRQYFFKGQMVHLLLLIVLLIATVLLVDLNSLRASQFLGIGTDIWFAIAIAVPILHQIYVWLAWRSELCFGTITRWFGSHGFVVFKVVFMLLFLSRPISLILLAIADHDSFELSIPARIIICVILGVPAVYTLYSVVRYFGIDRAAGTRCFRMREEFVCPFVEFRLHRGDVRSILFVLEVSVTETAESH